MARFEFLAVLLAVTFSVEAIQLSSSNVEVSIVHNLTSFLKENPEVEPLFELVKTPVTEGPSGLLAINYVLGERINGDRLVASSDGDQKWGTPQDVKLDLSYPKSGIGSIITYVSIAVEQSSNLGKSYVVSGGIGQRQITVAVEAQETLYFKYKAEIYGY